MRTRMRPITIPLEETESRPANRSRPLKRGEDFLVLMNSELHEITDAISEALELLEQQTGEEPEHNPARMNIIYRGRTALNELIKREENETDAP